MIVLDSDPVVIDLRYPRDSRYVINRQALDAMQLGATPLGMTSHTLLEIVGLLSFNSSAAWTADLPAKIPLWYGVEVLPPPVLFPRYADCEIAELVAIMMRKAALGDAVAIEQTRMHIPHATCFITWNARHFVGKLAVPALTPQEWLQQNQPLP